jgi:MFS family permease
MLLLALVDACYITRVEQLYVDTAFSPSERGSASGMRQGAWPAKIGSPLNHQVGQRGGEREDAMLAWLRDLTSRERRTMLACWGGWTLDGFDQQLYSYVVPTVIAVWGMSTGAAGTIGTVTVVTSSFGGWFAGALADRFGRVRMLQIAILWYSVFTFLCSFAQNFEQLFILRGLHGLGFGGEWATGAVLMGEVIRDKYRGRGVGFVQTGAAVGPGVAALVYAGLYAILPEAIAWRALFAVGILPALLVLWIRRSIPESEAFEGRRNSSAQPGIAHLFSAFRGPYLWLTIKVSLMVMVRRAVSGPSGSGCRPICAPCAICPPRALGFTSRFSNSGR